MSPTNIFAPLMSRETIGAGVASNTLEDLSAWIRRPEH